MKTFSSVAIALLTVGVASAQPAKAPTPAPTPAPAAKGAPATPPVAAKEMPAPTPAPEIKEALKMAGTLKCTGQATMSMEPMAPMKATMKTKADLDGFWVQETFDGTMGKTKFKFVSYTTFDSASKKWRRVMVDNMGGQMIGTSDGMKDGKMTFNMDTMGGGASAMFKDSIDATDPKALKASGEISMDKGKTWNKVYEMTCKK